VSAHDINGPSQLSKREACPGSAKAEQEIPRKDSPEASRGTLGHAWIAAFLRGKPLPDIPEDLIESCSICVDTAKQIKTTIAAQIKFPSGDPIVLVEHKVDLSHLGIKEGGTIDFALIWPGVLGIFLDWKFGDLWTDNPKFNRQIQGYGSGLANDFGLEEVWGGICQPELRPDLRVRVDKFTSEDLERRATDIRRIVAWTQVSDPPRRPGEHCGFCGAKDACAARQAYGAQLSLITQPAQVFFAGSPDDRKALWEKIGIALSVLGKAKEQITDLMKGDPSITMTGYQIGEGKGKREWIDPDQAKLAMHAIALEKGMDADVVEPRKLLSPSAAEDLFGKAKAVRERLEKIVKKIPGDPAVVAIKGGK